MSGTAYNLTPKIEKQLIQKRVDLRWQLTECAEWLSKIINRSVSPNGLSEWFKKKGLSSKNLGPVINTVALEENVEEKVSTDKQIESYKAQANYYKKLYGEAIKSSSGIDDIIRVAKEVTNAIPAVKVIYKPLHVEATTPQSAIAPLCDLHLGEVVSRQEMAGINEYNFEIFNRRLRGWTEQVVKLVQLRKTYVDVPRLYVPLIGDLISGDIHLELMKTNEDNVVGQMIRGANLISQALIYLSQYFEEITVPCVVGNHGRMTQKPPAKEIYVSYDYMLSQWCAAFCRNQKNIKFEIPKSFMHVFQVEGKNILMMHGDSIKSWGGSSLPAYGIVRAIGQMRQVLQFRRGLEEDILKLADRGVTSSELISTFASYFDSVILGHFHRVDEIDIGTGEAYICGTMKGADEFSLAKLHAASLPKQILLYVHPRYGIISKETVLLSKYDNSNNSFVDALPNVWIDSNPVSAK